MERPAGIGQEQPANPPTIERVGAFGEQLPGAPGPAASLRPKPEEPAPSPPSEALPQPSDYRLVSIGESTRPLVPTFCFAPLPVPLQALGLDIRYDNESRHYYVAEATLEKVLERCNTKRQECESHGLLSPAHNVTLPLEAREAFKIPREAERCAVATPAGTAYPAHLPPLQPERAEQPRPSLAGSYVFAYPLSGFTRDVGEIDVGEQDDPLVTLFSVGGFLYFDRIDVDKRGTLTVPAVKPHGVHGAVHSPRVHCAALCGAHGAVHGARCT
jgi:hypothetical protein